MGYTPVPFAGRGRLSDLVREQGRNRAESELRRGDISAQMWAGLGNTIANTVGQIAQQRQDAPRRAMQDEAARLELEQARAAQQARQQSNAQEQALRELFAGEQLPDPRAVMRVVGPERGAQIVQGLSALQSLQTKSFTDGRVVLRDLMRGLNALPEGMRAETYPAIRQQAVAAGVIGEQDAPEVYDPNWWKQAVSYGQQPEKQEGFTLKPGDVRFGPDGQQIANVPEPQKAPEGFTLSEGQVRYGPGGKVIARGPAKPVGGGSDNEPLVPIPGPNGTTVYGRRSQAVGLPIPSTNAKPASGLEKRALNFFNRARQADVDLEEMEPQIAGMGLAGQTYMAIAPNFAQTELGQRYTQAQRAFTEARLRKDSGAAIPEQEFENDRKTYFAQPGDSPETLEQKRRGRAAVLASLGFESGQALGEFVGDRDEAQRIVGGYKDRSTKKGKVTVTAPDGSKHDFATQAEADTFKKLAGIN